MCAFVIHPSGGPTANGWNDHRQLHSNRPPLPDVPAVYFVSPTLDNVRRISSDLANGLYESFHLNFVEPLSRALLEEFAASVAKDGTEELVGGLLDQYLGFISPSPALFSLLPPIPAAPKPSTSTPAAPVIPEVRTSYTILNSPSSSEQDIEDEIERIASGLFSAVATSGKYPCIIFNSLFLTCMIQDMFHLFEHPKAMLPRW
jgi:hypothetical protein